MLQSMGRHAEALSKYEEALKMWRACLPAVHLDIASSLHNIGVVLESMGRPDEALPKCEEALEMRRVCLPAVLPDIAGSLSGIGSVLNQLSFFAEAEQRFRTVLRRGLPPGHAHLLHVYRMLQHLTSLSRLSTRASSRHDNMLQRIVAAAKACREKVDASR